MPDNPKTTPNNCPACLTGSKDFQIAIRYAGQAQKNSK